MYTPKNDWINKLVESYDSGFSVNLDGSNSACNGCTGPLRVTSIDVTLKNVSPGDSLTLSADICSDAGFSGHVSMNFDDGNWLAGQKQSYSWSVVVPNSQPAGVLRTNVALYLQNDWVNKVADEYGAYGALTITNN